MKKVFLLNINILNVYAEEDIDLTYNSKTLYDATNNYLYMSKDFSYTKTKS